VKDRANAIVFAVETDPTDDPASRDVQQSVEPVKRGIF
jgi:hypothetical protein